MAGGTTPFATTVHITAGKWGTQANSSVLVDGQTDYIGNWYDEQTLAAATDYTDVFYRSAWGPSHDLPLTLSKNLNYNTANMFSDPSTPGFEASDKVAVTLSLGGKTVTSKTIVNCGDVDSYFQAKLSKSGWYTLNASATRYNPNVTYPSDLLSTKATTSFYFYDNPSSNTVAPVYLTRFVPLSLGMHDQATAGSTTTVDLHLDRTSQDPDAALGTSTVKTVTAIWSADGGTTWHALSTTKVGSYWTIAVPNPASGAVSLRSKVTDTKGDSSTVTIDNAYAVRLRVPCYSTGRASAKIASISRSRGGLRSSDHDCRAAGRSCLTTAISTSPPARRGRRIRRRQLWPTFRPRWPSRMGPRPPPIAAEIVCNSIPRPRRRAMNPLPNCVRASNLKTGVVAGSAG